MQEKFPNEEHWKDYLAKMRKYALRRKIKQSDVVEVCSKFYDFNRQKADKLVYYDFEAYWLMEKIDDQISLGELDIGSIGIMQDDIFIIFLDRFHMEKDNDQFKRVYWRIEYGILLSAYLCYKKNPQELEQILKVAKTKKQLKIHLGVS